MVTSKDCIKKYGTPSITNKNLVLWDVPKYLEIGFIPKKIYCNVDMIKPLTNAFTNVLSHNCVNEIKTFDGCFNIRNKRGLSTPSLHSWGIAIDFNAYENPLNGKSKWTAQFVKCFTDAGFDWGGNWISRTDPMHFQLSKI